MLYVSNEINSSNQTTALLLNQVEVIRDELLKEDVGSDDDMIVKSPTGFGFGEDFTTWVQRYVDKNGNHFKQGIGNFFQKNLDFESSAGGLGCGHGNGYGYIDGDGGEDFPF